MLTFDRWYKMCQTVQKRADRKTDADNHLWYKVFANLYITALFALLANFCGICHMSTLEYKNAAST